MLCGGFSTGGGSLPVSVRKSDSRCFILFFFFCIKFCQKINSVKHPSRLQTFLQIVLVRVETAAENRQLLPKETNLGILK